MLIGIVGTGVSGLTAAWLLSRHHDVHVFERDHRLGGHTHTVDVPRRAGAVPVDTGFIVYNEPTYPNLTRLLDELGVQTQPSDMSFAVRCERCDYEYAGNPRGLVAQRRNLLRSDHYRLMRDVARFNRLGARLVDDPRTRHVTLGRFLTAAGFSDTFARHYLVPMAAAIWSSGAAVIEQFPLGTLLRFFHNHGLLGVTTHHPWRTVTGGARSYLAPLTAPYADHIHTGDAVTRISREEGGVRLATASGGTQRFDKVVIAAHADEALGMLTDPSPEEKELLGAWDYSSNDAWLHTDPRLMPRRRDAWASWNYLLDDCTSPSGKVSLSYHMNRLQSLPGPDDYLVTLNPSRQPAADQVVRRMTYTHPVYTPESVATQDRLGELSGRHHTFYAGAYHRNGFHEDGVVSALRVAAHFGITWP